MSTLSFIFPTTFCSVISQKYFGLLQNILQYIFNYYSIYYSIYSIITVYIQYSYIYIGAVAPLVQEGLEELSHVEGQEGQR